MKKQRTTLLAAGVVAAMVGLAGCGGSSNKDMEDGQKTPAEMAAERATMQRTALTTASAAVTEVTDDLGGTPTQAVIDDARTKVAALETAINNAKDVPASELTAYRAQHGTADNSVKAAQMARTDADDEADDDAMAALKKTGEDLYKALRGTNASNNALGNITQPFPTSEGLTPGGLHIDVPAQAGVGGNTPVVRGRSDQLLKPKSGSSVSPLSGWKGMDFAKTEGTGSSAYTSDEARVYHNQGAPERVPFSGGTNGKYNVVASGVDPLSGTDISSAGFYAGNGTAAVNLAGTSVSDMIEISSFADEGTKRYPTGTNREAYEVAGTYDGAPGMYYCVPTSGSLCSSTINDGELEGLGGGMWYFKPNSGAMVSSPDNTYLYFGWWVSKDKDGVPTAASAFVGNVATPAIAADAGDIRFGWASSSPPTAGTATYTGAAVGKYAYRDISGGTAHGGHFTASAELKAKFGPTTTAGNGVTGTIDNFRLNDGTTDPGWSVSLNRASWGNGGGAIAASSEDDADAVGYAPANTTWSINDNAAPAESTAKGTWSGTMYDEKPGDAPDGDGSNIPTVVTGTFYSEFGSEGRMVGAFGANHSGN